jgi:NAD(P)-dependent dehydrogenase (short-subunit alcohol dehydrogenase family)
VGAGSAMKTQSAFRLDGRSVIVTGASSGLGVHFAVASAGAGADVVICGRRSDRLEATREHGAAAGGRCLAVPADVTSVDDCRRVVDSTLEAFGKVDVLINNAGVGSAVPATDETPEEFARARDLLLIEMTLGA